MFKGKSKVLIRVVYLCACLFVCLDWCAAASQKTLNVRIQRKHKHNHLECPQTYRAGGDSLRYKTKSWRNLLTFQARRERLFYRHLLLLLLPFSLITAN